MGRIVKQSVTLTASGVAYSSSVALPELGTEGRIVAIVARLDATLDEMDQGAVLIGFPSNATISATTPDEDLIYDEAVVNPTTGSATVAFIDTLLDPGRPYQVALAGGLVVALNATSAGGGGASTSATVVIYAEIPE